MRPVTNSFSKKSVGIFSVAGIIAFLLIVYITHVAENNIKNPVVPVTIEGTIHTGAEDGRLSVLLFIQAQKGTYYLIDDTDEISRRQKAHQNCPTEGTIDCYTGKRVEIKGLLTNKAKWIVGLDIEGPIYAHELIVKDFDVLK